MGKVIDLDMAKGRKGQPAEGRRADAMRSVADRSQPAGTEPGKEKPRAQRVYEINFHNALNSMASDALRHPERKISPKILEEIREMMRALEKAEASIEAEIDRLWEGAYPTGEEYNLAFSRICLALYVTSKIREMHEKVVAQNSDSLASLFVTACANACEFLSRDYFAKDSLKILDPYDWGFLDIRVRAPFEACARVSRVEVFPPDAASQMFGPILLQKLRVRDGAG